MNSLSVLGKYLDQPRLVGKFSKAVPAVLIGGASLFTLKHIKETPKEERKKEAIKIASVLAGTILSALIATRGIGKINIGKKTIFKGFNGLSEKIDLGEITRENTKLVNEFLSENEVGEKTAEILEKAKGKILKFKEVKTIFSELGNNAKGKNFLHELIPDPENVNSKEIFSEIGRLSIMGLVPVLGGIAGGILGDRLTEEDWKEKIPNKIKEGSYQYLANIFLCNVGAGAALGIMEKAKVTSKSARALGMLGGILLTGVVLGSAVANILGKIFIDPIFNKKEQENSKDTFEPSRKTTKLYSERKPEALDIGLHVDDVATVAVLSGLKWIEPCLPILYSISGYRAGTGYRNGHKH